MLKNNRFGISKLLKSKFLVFLLIATFGCINLKFIEGAEAITLSSKDCLANVYQTGLLLHLDAGSPCQTGSTSTWLDTSGNSKNLSLVNSPSFTSASQKYYNFNGTNQYGTIPSGFSDFTNGISITFYAKWTSNTGLWDRIIDLGYSPSGYLYSEGSDNILVSRSETGRNVTLEFYKGAVSQGSCVTNTSTAITANTWKHYALVVSPTGDKCRIYVDNVLVSTATDPTYSGGMPNVVTRNSNFIGESNWVSDQFYNGSISDLAVYNLSLTDSQVATNYFAQTGLAIASSTTDAEGYCTQTVNTLTGASSKRVGDECVISFLSNNDWSAPSDVTNIQMLMVAGGGGGGFDVSGGGGAGGLLYFGSESPKTPNAGSLNISSGYLDITVGAGGAGATSLTTGGTGTQATGRGSNGFNSAVTLPGGEIKTAIGGGGGNSRNNTNTAQTGGSGGGGGYNNGGTPTNGGSGTGSGTTLQGFAGGKIQTGSSYGGGGGGGAGAIGTNWIDGNASAGFGGNGLTYSISGSATAYGGGGGGGSWNAKGGEGGSGGGGAGGSKDLENCRAGCTTTLNSQTGQVGTDGTGGGGGGSGWAGSSAPAGKGGSGIVVIRYTIPPDISTVPSITGSAGYLQTLSGSTGSWINTPTAYEYKWSRSATSDGSFSIISGAVASTYNPVFSDIGQFLRLSVTASNSGGSSISNSLSTTQVTKATQNSFSLTSTTGVFLNALSLSVTGGSGAGGITYSVSNPGTASCSISNVDSLTSTSAGTCQVVASKAETSEYLIAYDTQTVTIGKASLTFVASAAASLKYGGTTSVTYTTNRSLGIGSVPNLTGTLSYETSTTTACTVNSSTGLATMRNSSGSCNLRVSLVNDTNYSDTSSALISITPAKADAISLTAVNKSSTYTGSASAITPTYSVSGLQFSDTVTVTYNYSGTANGGASYSLSATKPTNAGIYSIVPTVSLTNSDSYTATSVIVTNGTLTINRANRTLSPTTYSSTSLKYGDTATATSNTTSPSSNSDGTFSYTAGAGCSIDSSTGQISATTYFGSCLETTTVTQGNNYETATATALTFTLSKADTITVTTATPTALTYTGSPAAITPTATVSGLVAGNTATGTTFNFSRAPSANATSYGPLVTAPTNAGSYVITPSALTLASGITTDYYKAVVYETATLAVNKASQSAFTNYSTLYGIFGAAFTVYKFGGSGDGIETMTVTNGTATGCALSGTVLIVTTAGTCVITATKATSENYLEASSTFTVILYYYVPQPPAPVSTMPTEIAVTPTTGWSINPSIGPTITGISSSSGPVGTVVTVTGTGMDGVDVIKIGRKLLTSITGISSTSVSGIIPAGAVSGPIFVSNSLGGHFSADGFTVTS